MKKNKKEYYAVFVGRKLGIYRNWKECEEQVLGYRGARYRGYTTEEEAYREMEEYIYNSNDDTAYGYDDDCIYVGTAGESYIHRGEKSDDAAHIHYDDNAALDCAPILANSTDLTRETAHDASTRRSE